MPEVVVTMPLVVRALIFTVPVESTAFVPSDFIKALAGAEFVIPPPPPPPPKVATQFQAFPTRKAKAPVPPPVQGFPVLQSRQ
jgi:hypothetical protein